MLLTGGPAVFAHLRNNLQIVRLLVKAHLGLAILEEDHGGGLVGRIPQLGQLRVVLLLDAAHRAPVLEEGLGPEDVVLDLVLGVGVVEVDEDRLVFGEQVDDLVHGIVLGHAERRCRRRRCGRRQRYRGEGMGAAAQGGNGGEAGNDCALHFTFLCCKLCCTLQDDGWIRRIIKLSTSCPSISPPVSTRS